MYGKALKSEGKFGEKVPRRKRWRRKSDVKSAEE